MDYVISEDRKLWKWIVFGLITCGIYQLYMLYTISRDVNIMCEYDGEETPGLLKYILLSIITCGIYSYYWHYKLLRRLEGASEKYGFEINTFGGMDLAVAWLLFSIIGIFTTAGLVGLILMFYAVYLLLSNMNACSIAYNNSSASHSKVRFSLEDEESEEDGTDEREEYGETEDPEE